MVGNLQSFIRFARMGSWLLPATCVAALLVAHHANCRAQSASTTPYETKTVHPFFKDRRTFSTLRSLKSNVLRGNASFTESTTITIDKPRSYQNSAWLQIWYKNVLFASMAEPDENGGYPKLVSTRTSVAKDLAQEANNRSSHGPVLNLVLNLSKEFYKENYHPAVRVNAMLIVGALNDQEGSSTSAPIPSTAARKILLTEFQDAKQSDEVKVAALVGIARHVETEVARTKAGQPASSFNQDVTQIVQLMTQLIGTDQPPGGRSLDGHHWMQRRAMQLLGLLEQNANNAPVIGALERILQNANAPISLRCVAADTLGRLQVSSAGVDATAKALGGLVIEACDNELNRIQAWEEELASMTEQDRLVLFSEDEEPRSREPLSDEELEEFEGDFEPEPIEPAFDPNKKVMLAVRRRLLHELGCVRMGLGGADDQGGVLKAAAGKQNAPIYVEMHKIVKNMIAGLSKKDVKLDEVKATIQGQHGKLVSLMKSGAPTPKTEPEKKSESVDDLEFLRDLSGS